MTRYTFSLSRWALPLAVVSVYLFLYIPIIVLVLYSFNSAPFPAPWASFSLKWYHELFSSPHIWYALQNSLIVSTAATSLSLLMAVGLVYYNFMGGAIQRALYLFYGNIIIPDLVLAVGLLSLFAYFAVPLGIPTLIVAHTILGVGFAVPLVYTRYKELRQNLVEASFDLGATKTQTFVRVILPLLKPALIAAGLLIFILSFDDFILAFFTAGSETQTLSLFIFSAIRSGASPVINALSTLLLLFSSLLVTIFTYLNIETRVF
jgi:spermidine/putrescine transport system permease protein